MKKLFLPGKSIKNQPWIHQLSKEFEEPKTVIEYEHWNGKQEFDIQTELEKIAKLEGEYTVICKSIGSLLTLLANKEGILDIKRIEIIGLPYILITDVLKYDLKELFELTTQPITIIQKENDPAGGYDLVKEFLDTVEKDISIIRYEAEGEPNDTHQYEDTKYLKSLIK